MIENTNSQNFIDFHKILNRPARSLKEELLNFQHLSSFFAIYKDL